MVAVRWELQAPDTAAIATAPMRTGRKPARSGRIRPRNLVVTQGSLQGTVLPLGSAPVTIGRAADNTLVVDDDYASSHHARLYQTEGRWIVEDVGSTNGTWIERNRITGPTLLEPGAPLRVGRTIFELRK